jgi:hypothetical protein
LFSVADVLVIHPDLVLKDTHPGCVKIIDRHSFSGDHVLLEGFKAAPQKGTVVSKEHDDPLFSRMEKLKVLPFYHGCYRHHLQMRTTVLNFAEKVWNGTIKIESVKKTPRDRIVWPLNHDWGGCVQYRWTHWFWGRGKDVQPDMVRNTIVMQNLGDWDCDCFIPHKDVVVPPRTPASESRLQIFCMDRMVPINQRQNFALFRGTPWGTGAVVRNKLIANRDLFPTMGEFVSVKSVRKTDYPEVLMDTQFCIVPAGVVTFSFRMMDALYAGCIPVITSVRALSPFFDLIDYSQMLVVVPEMDLMQIESVLLSITPDQKQRMQINWLRVRSMFLFGYPDPIDEVNRLTHVGDDEPKNIGPLEMTLLNFALRLLSHYPTTNNQHASGQQ